MFGLHFVRRGLLALSVLALLALSACTTGTTPPIGDPPPGDTPQAPPRIVSVTGEGTAQITVTAEDVNGDDIFVTANAPAGVKIAEPTRTIPGGTGSATFVLSSTSVNGAISGNVTIEVSDSAAVVPVTKLVPFEAPPFDYAADTIYAIPQPTAAETGEPVTIVVSTGTMANPLAYMTGVRVVLPKGAHYVANSFNVGTPGGAKDATDGVWDALPEDYYILMPPDSFLAGQESATQMALDFNVTPVKDGDSSAFHAIQNAKGDLFNFQVVFDHAGEYSLSFVDTDIVDRTYYHSFRSNDETGPDGNFWGDSSNAGGPANTITVTGDPVDPNGGFPKAPVIPLGDYDFTATARPESFTFGGSLDSLSVTYSEFDEMNAEWLPADLRHGMPDLMEAQIHVAGAQDLTGLYIDLTFPSDVLDFEYAWTQGTETADWIMGPPNMMYDGPNNICFFANAPNPHEFPGFTGDGVVARIYFHKVADSRPSAVPQTYHTGYEPPAPSVSGTALTWGFYLPGDYNQDGSVNIYDFQPMAYHFGAADGDADSVTSIISGPDHNAVNITAITMIGVMYMGEFDSYNVYSGPAGSYPDGGTLLGNVPLSAGTGDALQVRRQFAYELGAAPAAGTQLWLRTVRDGSAGAASAVYTTP